MCRKKNNWSWIMIRKVLFDILNRSSIISFFYRRVCRGVEVQMSIMQHTRVHPRSIRKSPTSCFDIARHDCVVMNLHPWVVAENKRSSVISIDLSVKISSVSIELGPFNSQSVIHSLWFLIAPIAINSKILCHFYSFVNHRCEKNRVVQINHVCS